jgi:perosamine synthetase
MKTIPVCEPVLDGNEKKYVIDCLDTNWISSQGKYISMFEEQFSNFFGMSYGVSCSNCTTALHMALVALGIGPGDEVILPDFTLIISANTIIQTGATPVLVDVDPKTWCIDATKIEEKITPRTRAIMAVHMYGHPCDMPSIMAIAQKHNLRVIEDCAESHGAEIDGKLTGTFGEANCFSFYGNKIVTTGEGGMVLCRDENLANLLRKLRNQGFQEPRFVHEVVGFNYRMTNIQAAIGLAQTEKLKEKIEKKCWIGKTYNELLAGKPDLTLPYEAPNAKNVYWMYGILVGKGFGMKKDALMQALKNRGVETRSFFCPMHMQPVFQGRTISNYPLTNGNYPVSIDLWERGLYLPSGLGLTLELIERVVEQLLHCHA